MERDKPRIVGCRRRTSATGVPLDAETIAALGLLVQHRRFACRCAREMVQSLSEELTSSELGK